MGRQYTRVGRLFRLVQIIQSKRGLKASDLARLCEVHQRTVYRDINTLNLSGIPCGIDCETEGYCVKPGFFMPPIELTFEEAMAMVALLEKTALPSQVQFMGVAHRVAEKIRSQLPPQLVEDLQPLDRHVSIDLARAGGDESARKVYDDVRLAISRRRILRCTYEAASSHHDDRDRAFDLRAYQLWYCQRAWYAVGHHGSRSEVRMLKLNRFTFIQKTDRPYHIPDDFSLANHLGLAWRMIRGTKRYNIVIRFNATVADSVTETRWHPSQEPEEWNDDGSVTMRFTVDGLDEIVWWVLGYGPNAKVVEPKELVDRVRALVANTARNYENE